MRQTKRWSVVFCASVVYATAAWSAAPPAALAEQRATSPASFDAAATLTAVGAISANPTISLGIDRSRGVGPAAAITNNSQLQAAEPAPADDEARASLALMLASWGLVALIAVRRLFG